MEGFQPPPFASALIVAILLIVGNGIVILMTTMCARGAITRGGLAGIRTGATRYSDAAWTAGHVAALPIARIGNGLGMVAAASTMLLSTTVVPYLWALGITVVVTLGSVVASAVVAHRAAEAQIRRDEAASAGRGGRGKRR